MNNEEKILSMLEQLAGDLSGFKADVNARLDTIDDRFDGIDAKLDKNFADLADSQAHLAEVVGESHQELSGKLDLISGKVRENTDAIAQLAFDYMVIKRRA